MRVVQFQRLLSINLLYRIRCRKMFFFYCLFFFGGGALNRTQGTHKNIEKIDNMYALKIIKHSIFIIYI